MDDKLLERITSIRRSSAASRSFAVDDLPSNTSWGC